MVAYESRSRPPKGDAMTNEPRVQNQINRWTAVRGRTDGGRSTLKRQLINGYEIALVLERNEDGVLICSSVIFDYPGTNRIPDQTINSSFFQKLKFGELLMEARNAYVQLINVGTNKNEESLFCTAQLCRRRISAHRLLWSLQWHQSRPCTVQQNRCVYDGQLRYPKHSLGRSG